MGYSIGMRQLFVNVAKWKILGEGAISLDFLIKLFFVRKGIIEGWYFDCFLGFTFDSKSNGGSLVVMKDGYIFAGETETFHLIS